MEVWGTGYLIWSIRSGDSTCPASWGGRGEGSRAVGETLGGGDEGLRMRGWSSW